MKLLYAIILILLLTACKNKQYVNDNSMTNIELIEVVSDSVIKPDKKILSIIAPYKDSVDKVMNEVVGVSDNEYEKAQPNGALNNLFSDILMEQMKNDNSLTIDFLLFNYGGIRKSLPKGNVLKSDIFQLMPFENELVVVKLKPEAMIGMFDFVYKSKGQPVSGLKIYYKDSVVEKALINGKEWNSQKSYYVMTSDYVANGGDVMSFFNDRDTIYNTGRLIRDVIFEYLDSLKENNLQISGDTLPRIIFE